MMDRSSELEEFKQLNLSLIAAAHGYEIDRKKSTKHSVLMCSGNDKIIISQKGRNYVYCSVYDPSSNGTAIDFAQKVIEPGCNLGRVRQILRPFMGGGYLSTVQSKVAGRYAAEIKPSNLDLAGVAARYEKFAPVAGHHEYLCRGRGIPAELIASRRLQGRIRHCPRRGAAIFPHWGLPEDVTDSERCLTGFEIKGPGGLNMFSKGGRKGLWVSRGMKNDTVLAVAESPLDALSYLAIENRPDIRVASVSGKMNAQQPDLVRSAIGRMAKRATIVAAFDNDAAGDALTQQLRELVQDSGRRDLVFRDHRPSARSADWNQVLRERHAQALPRQSVPSLGR